MTDAVRPALRPCPFCGATVEFIAGAASHPNSAITGRGPCILVGTVWSSTDWNRRAPEPAAAGGTDVREAVADELEVVLAGLCEPGFDDCPVQLTYGELTDKLLPAWRAVRSLRAAPTDDTRRLDWLDAHSESFVREADPDWSANPTGLERTSFRAAVDAAMHADGATTP